MSQPKAAVELAQFQVGHCLLQLDPLTLAPFHFDHKFVSLPNEHLSNRVCFSLTSVADEVLKFVIAMTECIDTQLGGTVGTSLPVPGHNDVSWRKVHTRDLADGNPEKTAQRFAHQTCGSKVLRCNLGLCVHDLFHIITIDLCDLDQVVNLWIIQRFSVRQTVNDSTYNFLDTTKIGLMDDM